jgi:cytidylate kinase
MLNSENRTKILRVSGPAGAGKGPLGEALAALAPSQIGETVAPFDRGLAEFRTDTVIARIFGIDLLKKRDQVRLERLSNNLSREYCLDNNGKPIVYLGGHNITAEARSPWVDRHVALVSHIPYTHTKADALQVEFIGRARQENVGVVFLDTRDVDEKKMQEIGLPYLPIDITAPLDLRAKLRQKEFLALGQSRSLEQIQTDLFDRDTADALRENGRGSAKINGQYWHLERTKDSVIPVAKQIMKALVNL